MKFQLEIMPIYKNLNAVQAFIQSEAWLNNKRHTDPHALIISHYSRDIEFIPSLPWLIQQRKFTLTMLVDKPHPNLNPAQALVQARPAKR